MLALVTAFVSSRIWISASSNVPEWALVKTPMNELINVGDSAIAPAMLGMNPNVLSSS